MLLYNQNVEEMMEPKEIYIELTATVKIELKKSDMKVIKEEYLGDYERSIREVKQEKIDNRTGME